MAGRKHSPSMNGLTLWESVTLHMQIGQMSPFGQVPPQKGPSQFNENMALLEPESVGQLGRISIRTLDPKPSGYSQSMCA